jgi:cytochrome P450
VTDSADHRGFPLGAAVTRAELSHDPYQVFERLRRAEPITWARRLGQWLVVSRDLSLRILRASELFRTDSALSPIRDAFGPQMLSTEGDQQRRYKLACAGPFNARAVEQDAKPVVREIVREAVSRLGPRPELRTEYAAPIARRTVARVLGLSPASEERLADWYQTFAEALADYECRPETRLRAHAAAAAFRREIAPYLRAPSATERSLLAELARAHPRLLSDEEIGSNALIVLFGGIETTEASIANACWALLTHDDACARARTSDQDLTLCIEEAFRWEPAVQTSTRYVARDCRFETADLRTGDVVQCMIGAMNRDPVYVADSARYDPWRQDLAHFAFGFGRHFCLGAALARVETHVAIRALLDRSPRLTLDPERISPPEGHEFRKPRRLDVQRSLS